MKIQRRDGHAVLELPKGATEVFTSDMSLMGWVSCAEFYSAGYWEPVPDEPELVDVTDSLHYGEAERWSNCKGVMQKQGLNIVLNEDYEWRKIDAYVIPEDINIIDEWYNYGYDRSCFKKIVLSKYKQSVLTVWGPKL